VDMKKAFIYFSKFRQFRIGDDFEDTLWPRFEKEIIGLFNNNFFKPMDRGRFGKAMD